VSEGLPGCVRQLEQAGERKEAYTWSEKAAGNVIVELAETNLTYYEDLQTYLLESLFVGYIFPVCARVSSANPKQHIITINSLR
jgi:hypothetical protein